jgi:hypothetical protein
LLSSNVKTKIHRTIILPVLYGCETRFPTLREETQGEGIQEYGAEGGIWTRVGEVTGGQDSEELCDVKFADLIKSRIKTWLGRRGLGLYGEDFFL